ncbi:aminotransferase class I/II-fold pyridoxal phosphate-dependent enzyme [Acetomicrobium sp.]|uniref:aminotransferase class I/II-fold pyridoxal phosphate-dependent enzyme n=1 Tax=Acetomicrobium sp. TaxID=1872099 RepID=UPI001BCF1FDD|nr:aminotransferase class I/II-fold pyridoxal phosphate-dependent enzyme [Acetomicrobium sp.]
MAFKRMELEDWFDKYQFEVDYDIGESGVKFFTIKDLGVDLSDVQLRYGHHKGNPELRELIASGFPGLKASHVAVTSGASESIFAIMASLLGPSDNVLVEVPTYPSLYHIPQSLERDVSLYFLKYEDEFKLDIDRLAKEIRPNTKLICLTHPNNPTGSVITKAELEEVIRLVESKGIYLLMDETYRDLTFDEPLPLAATLSPKVISVSSMSKAFGVPGIRVGWVAADEWIIDSVRAVREQITICNPAPSEKIAMSILQRKDEFLKGIKTNVIDNFKLMNEWIQKRDDIEWIPPKGGVVGFPRLVKDEAADDLCRLLVERYRTFVVPGYCLKMPRHFRLGYGGHREEIINGLERLDKALRELYSIQK